MIRRIVDFALRQRVMVVSLGVMLLLWGMVSFHNLPVEAYPDVANIYTSVITQWPGHAAEEVEQQITIPIETQMNGIAHLAHLRSTSIPGLSSVTLVFDDDADNLVARQQTLEKLTNVTLPAGLSPQIGPDFSPTGQLYFYTLQSTNPRYDVMDLKALQDWEIAKQLKAVPDVADVATFGGATREYQVKVNPDRLVEYGIGIAQVENAIAANNVNTGGSFLEHGDQALNLRAIGQMRNTTDIGATVLRTVNGTPIHVRDVAAVMQGPKIRLGRFARVTKYRDSLIVDNDDAVSAWVPLRKGAAPDQMLERLHAKVADLNNRLLPHGVKIVPFLDRADLVQHTTRTVLHNLGVGILLVVLVLFLLLGSVRSALIVAATMPFSLLFAAILLDLRHIPANLLSLGALDFGMLVDGSVFMVENILRHVTERGEHRNLRQVISAAAHEVQRPVFYAVAIIIAAYLPIFTLQSVEGRLFRPMAWTVAFALLGSLLFAMLLATVLASFVFKPGMKEWHNPLIGWLDAHYRRALVWTLAHRRLTFGVAGALVALMLLIGLSGVVGSEFLPHLDEGAIWARGTLARSTGPTESARVAREARLTLAKFPEAKQVTSQIGRPDGGTDVTGFFNTEYFVDLKPREQWRDQFHGDKDALIDAMHAQLEQIPGVFWNFSQPISDNVEEAVSGVKGQLSVKVYGDSLPALERTADAIAATMRTVPGVRDLGVFSVLGQPNVNLVVDRARADRYGINVSDVQDAIETAAGGKAVTQILDGERRFDVVVRYLESFRRTPEDIANIRILAPDGQRVALGQVADIHIEDGASMIYREGQSRYIAIGYGVRGRDLGSTVREAMDRVQRRVTLPAGYHLDWAGESESEARASKRLALIIPITLLLICLLLYTMFASFKWTAVVLLAVVLAPLGGFFALLATGTHFSVSSGIGFLALFGVSVQIGVIMVEYINQLRGSGMGIDEAAVEGAVRRLRPILLTMVVATLGLLPAAMSHEIGSDSQRPFAIVIVGGLVLDLIIGLFLLPNLYVAFARPSDELSHHALVGEELSESV
ncbi:MAG TPA: CusA/CzcA family heavy metal efflux RND transporter [Gemmatimonadaceae bacterium]